MKEKIQFSKSLKYPFKGIFFVLKHKSLWKYIWIPLLIDLALIFVLIYLASYVPSAITSLPYSIFGEPGESLQWWIKLILGIGVYLGLFFIFPMIFFTLAMIVAPIFNPYIYHGTRKIIFGTDKSISRTLVQDVKLTLISIGIEIKKLALGIILAILLLMINFIPLLGQITNAIIGWIFVCFILGWNGMSYYLEDKGIISFREQFRILFFPLLG